MSRTKHAGSVNRTNMTTDKFMDAIKTALEEMIQSGISTNPNPKPVGGNSGEGKTPIDRHSLERLELRRWSLDRAISMSRSDTSSAGVLREIANKPLPSSTFKIAEDIFEWLHK